MYVTRHSSSLLAAMLVLWRVTSAHADCTVGPVFFNAIAGNSQDSTADLDLYANTASQCSFLDPVATGRIHLHERLLFNDSFSTSGASQSLSVLDIAPSFTLNATGELYQWLHAGGTITQTSAAGLGNIRGLWSDMLLTSATATVSPVSPYFTLNQMVYDCNNVACGTAVQMIGVQDSYSLRARGASGSVTMPLLVSFSAAGSLATDTAGGSVTLSTREGFRCNDFGKSGAGTATLTDNVCINFQEQTQGATTNIGIKSAISSGTGKWFLAATGTADSSIAGKFFLGGATLTVPSAKLHLQEQTVGNEILRVESVATNDDPNLKYSQQRIATTGSTATVLQNITATTDNVYQVEARVVGRCTGGVSCTVGQGIGCIETAVFKNVSGTVSQIGTTVAVATGVDITGLACATAVTFGAATAGGCTANTDFCLKVTGGVTQNITWHNTMLAQNLGS